VPGDRLDHIADGPEADRDGANDASVDQRADFVHALRQAACEQFEAPKQLPAFDADVGPGSDWEGIAIMPEQGHRVALEVVETPASRIDDVAIAIDRCVGHDEVESVIRRAPARPPCG
jgi:hypothetical protein